MAESSGIEMKAHERTYGSFINLLKFGAVFCLCAAFLVMWMIS